MASTSIVITGDGLRSSRCIMPPLIAPGSVGIWVCPPHGRQYSRFKDLDQSLHGEASPDRSPCGQRGRRIADDHGSFEVPRVVLVVDLFPPRLPWPVWGNEEVGHRPLLGGPARQLPDDGPGAVAERQINDPADKNGILSDIRGSRSMRGRRVHRTGK